MRNIMFWLKQENVHLKHFCCIFKLLARPLPKSLEKIIKIPVKTDIIENNISLNKNNNYEKYNVLVETRKCAFAAFLRYFQTACTTTSQKFRKKKKKSCEN